MKSRILLTALALAALPAASMPGFFDRDAREPRETVEPVMKAGATCSLWARYNPEHVVWQEIHFQGGFEACGRGSGYFSAASAAALGLPDWTSFGYNKVGVGPSPPSPDPGYACSVNVDFEPATPTSVQIIFTGAATCQAQRNRVLAVVKGAMACYTGPTPCPWSNP